MVIKETLVVRNETYCWYPELNHYSWCQTETKILEIVPIGSLIILSFLFGLITFTAIYGNGLVVYLVATTKSLHNTTHYLLANLAISDILLAVVCIPFQFYAALIQRWDLPHFMCKLCPFTQIFSVNVSIFTQIAIALDRYGATTQPLSNSDNSRTKKRIFVLIWAIAFLLASPVPSFFQIRYLRDAEYRGMKPYCSSWSDEEAHKYGAIMPSKANLTSFAPSWMTHENYVLATFTYQYLIPVVFIGVMYIHMCIVVWKRNIPGINLDEQAKELWRQKKKIIRIKIWILLAFVVCWLPWQIIHVAAKVYPEATRFAYAQHVFLACQWLAMSNSSCNPFIYTLLSDNYKKLTRALFCGPQNCIKLWKQQESEDLSTPMNEENQALEPEGDDNDHPI